MKYLVIMLLVTQFALFARTASAQAVPFSASAYNWDNSPNNFNNSPTTGKTVRITTTTVPITSMLPMVSMTTKAIV